MDLARSEWMALALARLMRDGDRVSIGTNLPVARAAALLAKLTHAPNLVLYLGMAEVADLPGAPIDFTGLAGAASGARKHWRLEEFFGVATQVDFFVVGGLQIDPYGNTNLLGIGDPGLPIEERYRQRTLLGPGTIGTATMTTCAGRYVLFVPDHQPRAFVEQLAFRSTCGWGTDGREREGLGLPGGGPVACVTDLGLFDYPAPRHRMRIVRPFPGVDYSTIAARTGFAVDRPQKLQEFAGPSPLELATLRERVDPGGLLR
ncbi:MAG: hypothetical protein ABI743_05865 [bacterium]